MRYLIIKNGVISNIIVCESDSIASKFNAVPSYEGASIGDPYSPPGPSPSELRELAYTTEKLVTFRDNSLTIDEANDLFLKYFAEGSSYADELKTLIAEAKASVRERYPD